MILVIYFLCLAIAGFFKGWNNLELFQPLNLKLPIWTTNRKFMPMDSWHFTDAMIHVFTTIPFIALLFWFFNEPVINSWSWHSYILFIVGSWMAFYQSFIYCYHGYGRIIPDYQHIWESYNILNYF